jgi:hypothetical protein
MKVRAGWIRFCGVVAAAALLTGCGSDFGVAPVKGKVLHNGKAVEGGAVTLHPVEVATAKNDLKGKPASGQVNSDGTFVLSTYGTNDGAVIGKHSVSFFPVVQAAKSYDDKPAASPYAGLVPKDKQVEIKSGRNELTIELVKP